MDNLMSSDKRIVIKIPLDELWNKRGILKVNRKRYLTKEELTNLLKIHQVEFVIANVGDKLLWIPIDKCYEYWQSEIKHNVIQNSEEIWIDEYPNGYVFIASEWLGDNQFPIILLEKLH